MSQEICTYAMEKPFCLIMGFYGNKNPKSDGPFGKPVSAKLIPLLTSHLTLIGSSVGRMSFGSVTRCIQSAKPFEKPVSANMLQSGRLLWIRVRMFPADQV